MLTDNDVLLKQWRSQDPKTDEAGLASKRPNQQGHNIKMAMERTTMHILIYNLHYKKQYNKTSSIFSNKIKLHLSYFEFSSTCIS
jgi:hypothetical protein